ncbi:MAG: hypothetical protein ACJAY6_003065, partial [Yoonia sp.]
MSFGKDALLAEFLEIQILKFFNRVGGLRTFAATRHKSEQAAIADFQIWAF